MSDFLTPLEVAKRLKISDSTVRSMCRAGVIEHHRVGKAFRITEEQLAAYVEQTKAELPRRLKSPEKPRITSAQRCTNLRKYGFTG